MFKSKTRRVKPPTRLFRLLLVAFVCAAFCSCSLFKVYAGKVEYADTQRHLHMSADSVYLEGNNKKHFFINPVKIRVYENSTY